MTIEQEGTGETAGKAAGPRLPRARAQVRPPGHARSGPEGAPFASRPGARETPISCNRRCSLALVASRWSSVRGCSWLRPRAKRQAAATPTWQVVTSFRVRLSAHTVSMHPVGSDWAIASK